MKNNMVIRKIRYSTASVGSTVLSCCLPTAPKTSGYLGHEHPPCEWALEQPHERAQRTAGEARRAQAAQVVPEVGVVDDQRRAKDGAEHAAQRIEEQRE
jgi:hypothetical protein